MVRILSQRHGGAEGAPSASQATQLTFVDWFSKNVDVALRRRRNSDHRLTRLAEEIASTPYGGNPNHGLTRQFCDADYPSRMGGPISTTIFGHPAAGCC